MGRGKVWEGKILELNLALFRIYVLGFINFIYLYLFLF